MIVWSTSIKTPPPQKNYVNVMGLVDFFLEGTILMVQPPKILTNVINPVIILKAGVYNQEVKQDILENINMEARFLE